MVGRPGSITRFQACHRRGQQHLASTPHLPTVFTKPERPCCQGLISPVTLATEPLVKTPRLLVDVGSRRFRLTLPSRSYGEPTPLKLVRTTVRWVLRRRRVITLPDDSPSKRISRRVRTARVVMSTRVSYSVHSMAEPSMPTVASSTSIRGTWVRTSRMTGVLTRASRSTGVSDLSMKTA